MAGAGIQAAIASVVALARAVPMLKAPPPPALAALGTRVALLPEDVALGVPAGCSPALPAEVLQRLAETPVPPVPLVGVLPALAALSSLKLMAGQLGFPLPQAAPDLAAALREVDLSPLAALEAIPAPALGDMAMLARLDGDLREKLGIDPQAPEASAAIIAQLPLKVPGYGLPGMPAVALPSAAAAMPSAAAAMPSAGAPAWAGQGTAAPGLGSAGLAPAAGAAPAFAMPSAAELQRILKIRMLQVTALSLGAPLDQPDGLATLAATVRELNAVRLPALAIDLSLVAKLNLLAQINAQWPLAAIATDPVPLRAKVMALLQLQVPAASLPPASLPPASLPPLPAASLPAMPGMPAMQGMPSLSAAPGLPPLSTGGAAPAPGGAALPDGPMPTVITITQVLDSDLEPLSEVDWPMPAELPAAAALPGLTAMTQVNAIAPIG